MTVRDLKLDTNRNLVLSSGNIALVSDGEAIVQAIRLRLGMFQGEWFLDITDGMPFFQEILIKNPNLSQIRSRFVDRIAGTPGVLTVESLTLALNTQTRTLTVTFKVTTDAGLLSDTAAVALVG